MYTLNCRGKLIVWDRPWVMGILNITHDSFYAASRYEDSGEILARTNQMISEGADIIDIGGQSTRPGSTRIGAMEELKRVIPVVELISSHNPDVLLSVDTYFGEVAKAAVEAGASIINDISAGSMDSTMLDMVALLGVPYVCMHMKGVPETMQKDILYDNLITEIMDFFSNKLEQLRALGIHDVILDPGFGFGKTNLHNFQLLNQLIAFQVFDRPIMVGVSRKSMIYKTLGVTAEEALNGTTVLNTLALQQGARILRVHDVKAAKEAIALTNACLNA